MGLFEIAAKRSSKGAREGTKSVLEIPRRLSCSRSPHPVFFDLDGVMIERKVAILFFAEIPLRSALAASLTSTSIKCLGIVIAIFCWKKKERDVKRQCWSALVPMMACLCGKGKQQFWCCWH
uniref:Uncharacterized protein n=1 Tax=Skeletonema marinoi TaxID=267567 RepID=A0A7S2KDD9_9STRA|mmetsp:Transcript_11249/g.19164  ORF Transcript_11249/g.19164 Transcript_11249/m.19164 type:complete len:122 (+) Transcript_11249:231-596(+)